MAIERWFLTGVRLKWTMPPQALGPQDGSIFDAPRCASRMIYDGLDGELVDRSLPNVTTLGFHKGMEIPHTWLAYAPGRTTRLLLAGGDVLTGPMEGCKLAQWSERGLRYVGHVGTTDTSPVASRRVKERFAGEMPSLARGFDPKAAWPIGEIVGKASAFKVAAAAPVILGLITTSEQFFSLLVFRIGMGATTEWCVGGIKRVPPMSYPQLKDVLLGRA